MPKEIRKKRKGEREEGEKGEEGREREVGEGEISSNDEINGHFSSF